MHSDPKNDWLITPRTEKSEARLSGDKTTLTLTNGLISRVFRLSPNAATVELFNHLTGETLLRGVKPEADVTLDGITWPIGGLLGQPDYGYRPISFTFAARTDVMRIVPTARQIQLITLPRRFAPAMNFGGGCARAGAGQVTGSRA